MKTYAFCMPIVDGAESRITSAIQLWQGDRRTEWLESRKAAGIFTERAWVQSTPAGSVLVLAHDVDDIDAMFESMMNSDAQFDVDFVSYMKDVHGIDPSAGLPKIEQFVSWTNPQVSDYSENWAVALPVTGGTRDEVFSWISGLFNDPEFAEARIAAGVSCQTFCWQETPMGNFAIIYGEGDSMEKAVNTIAEASNPIDRAWVDGVKRFTGLVLEGNQSVPPIKKVMDAEIAKPATV